MSAPHVRASSAYEALAFHGLAHLSLLPPRSLRDDRYLAWSRASLPEAARSPLDEDALAMSGRIEAELASDAVQWLPLLHRSIDALLATSRIELSSRAVDPSCESMALGAMRARLGDGIEWLRADVLLVARAFIEMHGVTRAEGSVLDAIRMLLSPFAPADVPEVIVLDHALGPRGRAFPEVVFVGAPATWNGLDACTPAMLALHEHAVRRSRGTFEEREWAALVRVARLVESSESLHRAHAAWLAEVSLDALLEAARARGAITVSDVDRVIGASDRSHAIARLGA